MPFNQSQVNYHISSAILKAMQLKQRNSKAYIGIALPNDKKHRRLIDTIRTSLKSLGIVMIWSDGKKVEIESSIL